ncbi:MAG: PD-(D/E)XK nuclease family protein, partial [Candidatus Eisenbacteria bacterium]
RVDVSRDGTSARVIDYKTGKAQRKGKKVLDAGRRLQLPVYLLAASDMLLESHPDAAVDAAEYLYIGGRGGPARLTLEREELDAAMEDLRTVVALIVRGVTSGMFFSPPEDAGCSFCDYADACGSTATALATMKKGDPRVDFFTELLGGIR